MYIDLGDCSYTCQHCGALFWFNKQIKNSNPPTFNLCCKNGRIKLPLLRQIPIVLDELLNYHGGPISRHFQINIRTYNSMFAFTSIGANIETNTINFDGPYIFKISGQVHHLIGSLLPVNNNRPKFAQLYIYDT